MLEKHEDRVHEFVVVVELDQQVFGIQSNKETLS